MGKLRIVLPPAVLLFALFGGVDAAADEWPTLDFEVWRQMTPHQLEELLAEHDVHAEDEWGYTALMWAARLQKDPAVLEVLLDAGADVNAREYRWGETVLVLAAGNQDGPAAVRMLIEAGADVNAPRFDGTTALMHAARQQQNPAVLERLIEAGADVHAENEDGQTALMLAAEHQKKPAVFELLIDAGADVNAYIGLGWTVLMAAARHQEDAAVLRLLIDAGASVNAYDWAGQSPLIVAAAHQNNAAVLEVLLEAGADVHAEDQGGQTALMFAERMNPNREVRDLLREAAASRLDDFEPQRPLYDESAVGDSGLRRRVLEENFFPIGWSGSGALAYVSRTFFFGQCGDCMSVEVVIQDTDTNATLWRRNLYRGEIYESVESNGEWSLVDLTLADIWASEAGEVIPQLNRYGIISDSSFEFLPGTGLAFSDSPAETEYRIGVDGVIDTREVPPPYFITGDEEGTPYDVYVSATVSLSSPDGREVVYEAMWDERHVLAVDIVGSLPSPHSDNAAIVLAIEYLGFEHDRLLDVEVIGVVPPARREGERR